MSELPSWWREPSFWWREAGIEAALLAPLAAVYGAVAERRLMQPGYRAEMPVVCVGNLTVGGAGKTPMALSVAQILLSEGQRPVFLSRGYGGSVAGPERVDSTTHRAGDVGDEPLLLARVAPAIVSRDRVAGARMAWAAGASVLVMDDGFQNPSLIKDFSIVVVDARRAIGNGRVIPAGPLRAPLEAQLERAHALVVVGYSAASDAVVAMSQRTPMFRAQLVPDAKIIAALGRQPVLAFAGIGDPEKFFATLEDAGIAVAAVRAFPDHHRFSAADAQSLIDDADRDRLRLVTTEKDVVRMHGDPAAATLRERAVALPVRLVLDNASAFELLLHQAIVNLRAHARDGG